MLAITSRNELSIGRENEDAIDEKRLIKQIM